MDRTLIAPSTDPAKSLEDLLSYAKKIQTYADLLHCDVMDGEFVPRKTISYDTVAMLKENCLLPLDVHLMVKNPDKLIENFADSGANIITVHYEAFDGDEVLIKTLKKIRKCGCLAGVSIKPNTPVSAIESVLEYVDLVLVMSVEPGKSGQSFLSNSLDKIKQLKSIKDAKNLLYRIEVDGGINASNSQEIVKAGADILVSGNYIYTSPDYMSAINSLLG